MTIKYIASDGTEFDSKEECVRYEAPKKLPNEDRIVVNNALEIISSFCNEHSCEDCPFRMFDSNGEYTCITNLTPADWTYI